MLVYGFSRFCLCSGLGKQVFVVQPVLTLLWWPASGAMAYCCMPGCKSSSKTKETWISFHEIPSNEELWQKWIKVISRDNWAANTTFRYSTVCSHFTASDFKEGCKTRRLIKGAAPSVFEEHPCYLRPSTKAPRSDAAIGKKASVSECPTATKRRAVRCS